MAKVKKGKNPIAVIRQPEAINKEYSELTLRLGSFQIEIDAIQKQSERGAKRIEALTEEHDAIMSRVQDLSDEMTESQAEQKRKQDEAAKNAASTAEVQEVSA